LLAAAFRPSPWPKAPGQLLPDRGSYHQEAGHVQHILSQRRQGQQWHFSFNQEWPIRSQTQQFSSTLP
jgi:hypothetical protein